MSCLAAGEKEESKIKLRKVENGRFTHTHTLSFGGKTMSQKTDVQMEKKNLQVADVENLIILRTWDVSSPFSLLLSYSSSSSSFSTLFFAFLRLRKRDSIFICCRVIPFFPHPRNNKTFHFSNSNSNYTKKGYGNKKVRAIRIFSFDIFWVHGEKKSLVTIKWGTIKIKTSLSNPSTSRGNSRIFAQRDLCPEDSFFPSPGYVSLKVQCYVLVLPSQGLSLQWGNFWKIWGYTIPVYSIFFSLEWHRKKNYVLEGHEKKMLLWISFEISERSRRHSFFLNMCQPPRKER